MLVEAGATRRAGRPGAGAGVDPQRRPVLRGAGCAHWAWSTRPSTRASTPSPRSSPSAWTRHPESLVADLRVARGLDYYTGTVYETQLVGDEAWGSVCSGGRYDSLACDGRTTYPGVGISIGLTRLVHLLVAKRGSRRAGRHRRRSSSPSSTRRAATASRRGRERPAHARHPVRGRAGRGALRQADPVCRPPRHPVRLVPGRGRGGDQVKDIRSGEQVDADALTWQCPPADLRPARRHAVRP